MEHQLPGWWQEDQFLEDLPSIGWCGQQNCGAQECTVWRWEGGRGKGGRREGEGREEGGREEGGRRKGGKEGERVELITPLLKPLCYH